MTMNLKKLLSDDRAVSPVIGVILMVAITVILAAVIGTFVLGLGDQVSQTTPNTSFGFDYDAGDSQDELTVSHNGGDTIVNNEAYISISGAAATNDTGTDVSGQVNARHNWSDIGSGSDLSAGSSATISNSTLNSEIGTNADGSVDLSGATVRIVWEAAEGDSSAMLGRWDGPDA